MSEPGSAPTRTCAGCNKQIAEGQHVEHRGAPYCTDCVGKALNGEASLWSSLLRYRKSHGAEIQRWLSARSSTGLRSPTAAVLLSLLPGLGQMYNGQLRKGVIVLGGFLLLATGGLVSAGSPLHVAGIVALYFWNLFDAYSTAQWINRGEMGETPIAAPPVQPVQPQEPAAAAPVPPAQAYIQEPIRGPSGALAGWGVFLIILGVLFLLNNFGTAWMTWERIWPTAMFALGIWILISFALSRREPPSTEPPSEEHQNV